MNDDDEVDPLCNESLADGTVNKINKSICTACDKPSVRICLHCGQEFCSEHFCPMHETNTTSEPLADDDGVQHDGQRIKLIGEGWPNALLSLDTMSDDQLRSHIEGMKKLLDQAIQTGNYASISIAAAEYKLAYREHSRYVKAMKSREKKLMKQGQILLNKRKTRLDTQGKQIPADILALMKAFDLSQEEAVRMKAVLGSPKA
jgi:hypothetical protein